MRTPSPSLRALTACAAGLFLMTTASPLALAQDGPPPPAQQQGTTQPLTDQQLDQLVAPIALYPDDLLGQILTASTYPLEAVLAARWSAANPNVKGPALEAAMQQEPWDPSIKALTSVPQVLAMMSDKLDWTQALGDAYLSQPDDIAAAVQRLRLKAQNNGNLQTTTQVRVQHIPAQQPIIIDGTPEPDYIAIEPVDPGVLYVPVYDPVVVYGPWAYPAYRPFFWSPPGFVAVGVIGFGATIVVGAAIWAHYDWQSRHVAVNVVNFNRFNHASLPNTLAGQTWEHNPLHRGNIPYQNAVLQQKFGKAATSNPNLNNVLSKPNTNLGNIQPSNLGNRTLNTNINTNTKINTNNLTNLQKTGTGNTNPNTTGNPNPNPNLKIEKSTITNTKINPNEKVLTNTNNNTTINNGKNEKFEKHTSLPNNTTTNNNTNTSNKPIINNKPVINNNVIRNTQTVVQHNNPPPPPPPHNAPPQPHPVGNNGGKGNVKKPGT